MAAEEGGVGLELKTCVLVNKKELKPNPGGFLATPVSIEKPGPYVVSASVEPGYYTMHMEKGEMRHKMGPKIGCKNVILSLYYEQYAKTLLTVGTPRTMPTPRSWETRSISRR